MSSQNIANYQLYPNLYHKPAWSNYFQRMGHFTKR